MFGPMHLPPFWQGIVHLAGRKGRPINRQFLIKFLHFVLTILASQSVVSFGALALVLLYALSSVQALFRTDPWNYKNISIFYFQPPQNAVLK